MSGVKVYKPCLYLNYLLTQLSTSGGSVTGAGEHAFCVLLTNDMCAEFASALSGIGETSCDLSAKAASDEISILIRLTEAGSTLVRQMGDRLYAAVQKTYENVTEKEIQTVYRYLDKCIDQLVILARNKE